MLRLYDKWKWVFFLFCLKVGAQDPSYSLHFGIPMTISPSMAGLCSGDASFRVSHRTRKLTDVENYSTTLFQGNYRIESRLFNGGAGLLVVNDVAGGLRTTEIQIALAYEAPLGRKVRYDHLRGGFQVGVVNRHLNMEKLVFEDQFDGLGFSLPTSESGNIANLSQFNMDVSMGLMYYKTQKIKGNPEFNPYLGFAIHHLNRPLVSFFPSDKYRMSIRYTFFGGAKMRTRTPLDFNLNLIYMIHNQSNLLSINPFVRFVFYENGIWFKNEKAAAMAGFIIRPSDSFVSYLGFDFNKTFAFAFAYDLLVSRSTIVNKNFGGLQLMVRYLINGKQYLGNEVPFPVF